MILTETNWEMKIFKISWFCKYTQLYGWQKLTQKLTVPLFECFGKIYKIINTTTRIVCEKKSIQLEKYSPKNF